MSTRKKPKNFAQRLLRRTWRLFSTATKGLANWVLRSLMVHRRRSRQSQAGFVLPTVVMVLLVVVLLTTAIVIRSFDRAKNSSNFRVNEAVLNAATPAIDRARAKLQYMFSPEENNIQGNTPTEQNIEEVLKTERYTFGDETQLTLVDDSAGGTPQTLATAWKFPADTDNNGSLDSFILYGIYFRNPPIQNNIATRARTPLEARALPQEDTGGVGKCGGEVAGGTAGWFPISGKLKKAFFTYVATVPITEVPTTKYKGTIPTTKFEVYTGNRGFSALEMQQDLARVALDNNAVWYENDIEINATTTLRLNGRVHTNSNLMVSNPSGDNYINFLQVSSPDSCFYDPENAKIVVGGNVAAGGPGAQNSSGQYVPNEDFTNDAVKVDLYNGEDQAPAQTVINAGNKTTQETPLEVASNSDAFARRLDVLVEGAMNLYKASNSTNITPALVKAFTRFPKEIGENFELKYDESNAEGSLRQTIDTYFRERIRRVSYAEVPIAAPPESAVYSPGTTTVLTSETTPTVAGQQFVFNGTGVIAAPLEWMLIENPNNGSVDGYTKLPLIFSGNTMELEATQPTSAEIEDLIGNRVLVGNGLPNRWVDTTKNPTDEEYYAPEGKEKPVFQNGTNPVNWNDGGTRRQREGRVQVLDDLGDTTRGGFWEQAAAKLDGGRFLNTTKTPQVNEELAGGLRVITGAGIYVDGETAVGAVGTGKRLGDPTVTQANLIAEVKSFLPIPAKPSELKANNVKIPDLTKIPNRAVNAPTATTEDDYFIVVWPDTMPMYQFVPYDPLYDSVAPQGTTAQPGEGLKGDLQMRATVVYHYKNGDADKPLACISSYYDPTDPDTAQGVKGWTNNGKNYPPPTTRAITPRLRKQARMIFPNGRWVNEPLTRAIERLDAGIPEAALRLDEKAAIDAANCALNILDNPLATASSLVPDGAIQEKAFLDARQVKALQRTPARDTAGNITSTLDPGTFLPGNPSNPNPGQDIANPETLKIAELGELQDPKSLPEYALPIEQRQPLEIRVTEIDLDKLRTTAIATEFLLPDSGIIYATRDDALPDISSGSDVSSASASRSSATDFKLDPTRRPNGIRLVNGRNLARRNTDTPTEKGLILASDLPVYIKGDFNLHLSGGSPVEEFNVALNMPATGENPGNFYNRTGRNDRFACRQGGTNCQGDGDQWRAARILSDAVTLLSNNFRDGFRNEGDYDFNNNAGNLAVKARLKNGFWWDNFATTADWYNPTNGLPKNFGTGPDAQGSSYVTNNVTPIQRRVRFPQYLMEGCTKKPVSECGPQDWLVAKDITPGSTVPPLRATTAVDTGVNLTSIATAGTTSQPPTPTGALSSSVRRVAFRRNEFGGLIPSPTTGTPNCTAATLTATETCTATPIAVNGTTAVGIQYGTSTTPPLASLEADNALWFATTTDPNNPSAAISYEGTNKLFYLPFDTETASERQLLLPGTPEFPVALNIPSLNGIEPTKVDPLHPTPYSETNPSDYAVCTATQFSKDYQVLGLTSPCLPETVIALNATAYQLSTQNPAIPTTNPAPGNPLYGVVSVQPFPAPDAVTGTVPPLTATAKINFFDLPTENNVPGGTITLDRGNQSAPIFVVRSRTGAGIGFPAPVTMQLNGVDPNNIFWVSEEGVYINPSQPHKLAGNFMGIVRPGSIFNFTTGGTNARIFGRILGFASVNMQPPAGVMTAMTTTDQPLLVPVLNLHSGAGTPGPAATALTGQFTTDQWLSQATNTTFNGVFVMGDSPSRPLRNVTRNLAESGGGLNNFPRFLEKWEERQGVNPRTARISGGLIEFQRSRFATAPFEPIDNPARDNSLFFDGDVLSTPPAYTANATNPILKDFRYVGGASLSKAPYYRPPVRQWGYDVGLLSQRPDLFSRRFVAPSAGQANEFYREVPRDDKWVKTLLCASQEKTAGQYEFALPARERPSDCPTL